MSQRAQVIFDNGKPAFVVVPYQDYVALTGEDLAPTEDDAEFVPFRVGDYIQNPIKAARIEAGVSQTALADKLEVSQGYISKIERRGYRVTERLMERVKIALEA
ncbi:MAG: helix-turn-helix transcriptional regulator [Magnetococcales bacterium]|nr:helix-turn-helix transcriptional regulator [Magnetococcales bacterium]